MGCLHAVKGAAAAGHGLTAAELSEDYLFPRSRPVMKNFLPQTGMELTWLLLP